MENSDLVPHFLRGTDKPGPVPHGSLTPSHPVKLQVTNLANIYSEPAKWQAVLGTRNTEMDKIKPLFRPVQRKGRVSPGDLSGTKRNNTGPIMLIQRDLLKTSRTDSIC